MVVLELGYCDPVLSEQGARPAQDGEIVSLCVDLDQCETGDAGLLGVRIQGGRDHGFLRHSVRFRHRVQGVRPGRRFDYVERRGPWPVAEGRLAQGGRPAVKRLCQPGEGPGVWLEGVQPQICLTACLRRGSEHGFRPPADVGPHVRDVNLLSRLREPEYPALQGRLAVGRQVIRVVKACARKDVAGGPDDGAPPRYPAGEVRGDRRGPAGGSPP
jgi:hypothetical protein